MATEPPKTIKKPLAKRLTDAQRQIIKDKVKIFLEEMVASTIENARSNGRDYASALDVVAALKTFHHDHNTI